MYKIQTQQQTALFVFSNKALHLALLLKEQMQNTMIYASKRIEHPDCLPINAITNQIQQAFKNGQTIIGFCASGIIIRALAPILSNKLQEPPVLSIAEDGSFIVPLLGGNNGANDLAHNLAKFFNGNAAITTSGYLRFGFNFFKPADDLELINKDNVAYFISSLIAGEKLEIIGHHACFETSTLPQQIGANLKIIITNKTIDCDKNTLVYRHKPKNGSLTIIGLGPGDKKYLTHSAKHALLNATDIFGYAYYLKLAEPYLTNQNLHSSDNKQELDRSYHALELAAKGKEVAMLSSGDAGVFGMASAVMECLHKNNKPNWQQIDIKIESGITAAQSAAARFGAPLGHDFCIISLSDNLKPFEMIEKRLIAALKTDMVLALYNPVSKARKSQILKIIEILKQYCKPEHIIMIGTDIGRPLEKTTITTLKNLNQDDITSRSILLVGSKQTRKFSHNAKEWVYTPRQYPSS